MTQISIAVNRTRKGKLPAGDPGWGDFTSSFRTERLDVDELIAAIREGYATAAVHKAPRSSANFVAAQHLSLDFDDGQRTLDELAADPFIAQHAALIHTTSSHTPAAPRLRVIFTFDRAITNPAEYEELNKATLWRYGDADPACKDVCRLMFGAVGCQVRKLGNVLTLETAAVELIEPYRQHLAAVKAATAQRPRGDVIQAPSDKLQAAVIARMVETVRNAPDGAGHDTLIKQARLAGGYIATGSLDEGEVAAALVNAYMSRPTSTPRDEWHAEKTTADGIAYGKGAPLHFEQREPAPVPMPSPVPMPDDTDDRGLLGFAADDEGNAQRVRYLYGGRALYVIERGWHVYTGTYWANDQGEAQVGRMVTDTLTRARVAATKADVEAVVKATRASRQRVVAARAQLADMMAVGIDQFDTDPAQLNAANGVIDLRTGQVSPHSPDQHFSYVLPVDYDPTADQSAWLNFLAGVVPDEATRDFLRQAVGYSLTGATSEECLFYVYGPARSGKGTFTETLLALLGRPLGTGTRFEVFTRERSGDGNNADLAALRPARFVTASESSRYTALRPDVIKSLTGGDHIFTAYKYRDHFTYRPQFKIWLTSNWPVNVDADDDAAWARVHVVEFPNSHAGAEDKTLKQRLKRPDALRGLLAWAVEGARQWHTSPTGLVAPASVKLATQRQRAELDTVQVFIDEMCTVKPGAEVTNPGLYIAYENWCNDNGIPPKKHKSLSQTLQRKGYELAVAKRQGKAVKVWQGLEIATAEIEL